MPKAKAVAPATAEETAPEAAPAVKKFETVVEDAAPVAPKPAVQEEPKVHEVMVHPRTLVEQEAGRRAREARLS
jgi:hypothetical protein